ncbi:RHS repeat domain-containing protein [Dyadobacter endophyticus]|uniref:RHS repeat domain-containing protein n=1 Tax=Dyadobacter endophyticus TaxID=1749036 RepID=UPI003CF80C47
MTEDTSGTIARGALLPFQAQKNSKRVFKLNVDMGKILAKTRLIFYVLVLLSSSGIYGQTTSKNFITERTYKLTTSAVSDDISTASRQLNYLDGLGRSLQTVSVSSSPETTYNTPSDLIVHTEYDSQGRVSKAIAPYPAVPSILSGSGSFKDDAITKSIGFYNNPANFCNNNDRAYALTEYEASPLNRVRKQYSVGTDKGVEFSYGLNGSEVKRYDVTLNPTTQQEVPTQNGNYAANQLTYVETKDENQNRVREYQDKSGTVVLKRAYNGSEEFSTYYVYDDLSQLRFVLQPMYQDDPSLDKYVFKYTYNSAGLMASKYVPGGGTTTLEYDARDRLIKSTDGRGIVSYTKYDNLNRVIETGHITGTSTENALVKTSYDAYPSGSEAYAQYSSDYPSSVKANVKGQVTAISTRVLASNGTYNTSDVWLANVMYYDDRYNVIQTVRNLYDLGGISRERSSRRLRFDGRLEQEFIEQAASTGLNGVEKFFAYDHADRLVSTRYLVKKDGTTKRDITLSANKYDALGQLKTKSLYSAENDGNYREQLDYCFTPRGWLSKVTGKTGGVENFGVELKYNIPTNGATAQYNGNIAEMLWKRGSAWVGYKFAYDGVNRLTNGEGVSGNTNRETISEYDKNGNIKKLQRAFDGVQKDNLTYVYNGNQLTKVTDAENNSEGFNNGSSGTGDDYLYDGNGNATKDANRNIGTNGIVYSVHNLVQQVTIAGGATLTYMYDGAGAKLRMANSNGAVNTKYAGAFEYNQSNYLTRIATEEGQINVTNNGNNFAFEYYLKDHLGNNRMVMSEAGTMTQEMEYFPFGLAIPRTAGTNKYLYNGKEKQPETGWLDYGARQYDATIGKWMVVDPLAEQFSSWSPYNYGKNNPIRFKDVDGLAPFDITLLGANNSSVTVKTDAVDLTVNASGLGVDFGGNYTLSGNDVLQAAVDIGGVFDPTPTLDIVGAGLSANSRDYWGAGASVLGAALPYVGDIAKAGKITKGVEVISDAVGVAKTEAKAGKEGVAGVVTGYTRHGLNQSIGRDGGRGVKASEMLEAVKNPKKVTTQNNGGIRHDGTGAKVVVNSDGKVISTFGKPRGEVIYSNGKGNNALNRAKQLGLDYDPKKIR